MTPNDDVIRKIQKLLALGQSSNEAEANSAMTFAQKLLAQHNLDFAMVQATAVAGGTVAPPEEARERTRISRSAQYRWQRDLWKAIAEANFCWWSLAEVYEGKRGTNNTTSRVPVKRHMILGRQSNVIAVRLMGEYLEDTMERILPYPNNERLSRSANSWKAGCADRLIQRVRKQAEDRKKESDRAADAGAGAIVLRSVYQTEYQANYDFRYGAGAFARKQLMDAEWEAGQEEREKRAAEATLKAEQDWIEYLLTETPQQKKAREREEAKEMLRQERARDRQYRSWANQDRRESRRVDDEAYTAGAKAGDKISIGNQVSEGKTKRKEIA